MADSIMDKLNPIMDKLNPIIAKLKEVSVWATKGPLGTLAGVALTLISIYEVFVDSNAGQFIRIIYDFIMMSFGLATFYVEADMKALPYAEAAKEFFELYFGFLRFLVGRGIFFVVVAFLEFSHSDSVAGTVVGLILMITGTFEIAISQTDEYEEIGSANLGSMTA